MAHHGELETVYEGIRRVATAAVSVVSSSGMTNHPYWEPPPTDSPARPIDEYVDELDEVLRRAVRRATHGVSCAVALSGGLDSTSIWAVMHDPSRAAAGKGRNHTAISLSYPGLSCDETDVIAALHEELGTTGHFIDASGFRPMDEAARGVELADSPFDPMALQMLMLARASRQSDAEVLITGIGGDEFLGGSPASLIESVLSGHWVTAVRDLWSWPDSHGGRRRVARRLVKRVASELLGRRPSNPRIEWLGREYRASARAANDAHRDRLAAESHSRRPFHGMLAVLQSGVMHEGLEQFAAVHGLELRHPLLHRELIEFSFRTPARTRIGRSGNKRLLRGVVERTVPEHGRRSVGKTVFDEILERRNRASAPERDMHSRLLVREGLLSQSSLDDLVRMANHSTTEERIVVELDVLELHAEAIVRESRGEETS